jgi:hypothetical protein
MLTSAMSSLSAGSDDPVRNARPVACYFAIDERMIELAPSKGEFSFAPSFCAGIHADGRALPTFSKQSILKAATERHREAINAASANGYDRKAIKRANRDYMLVFAEVTRRSPRKTVSSTCLDFGPPRNRRPRRGILSQTLVHDGSKAAFRWLATHGMDGGRDFGLKSHALEPSGGMGLGKSS